VGYALVVGHGVSLGGYVYNRHDNKGDDMILLLITYAAFIAFLVTGVWSVVMMHYSDSRATKIFMLWAALALVVIGMIIKITT
jgi:hypothetical protein